MIHCNIVSLLTTCEIRRVGSSISGGTEKVTNKQTMDQTHTQTI
jgi:hypothetical protein